MAEKVAREIVEQHGGDAVKIVRERAEAARLLGDELAAETWRDIATPAERMLREMRSLSGFLSPRRIRWLGRTLRSTPPVMDGQNT